MNRKLKENIFLDGSNQGAWWGGWVGVTRHRHACFLVFSRRNPSLCSSAL